MRAALHAFGAIARPAHHFRAGVLATPLEQLGGRPAVSLVLEMAVGELLAAGVFHDKRIADILYRQRRRKALAGDEAATGNLICGIFDEYS